MCYSMYPLSPLRWVLAVLLISATVLMVIGIATAHWVHYTLGNQVIEYGLWRTCTLVDGKRQICADTNTLYVGALEGFSDATVRALLIVSAAFCIAGIFCVFFVVNKFYRTTCAVSLLFCGFAATIFAWAGVGMFLREHREGGPTTSLGTLSYEWSFILACTSAALLTIVFFLLICYTSCDINKQDEVGMAGKFAAKPTTSVRIESEAGIYNTGAADLDIPEAAREPVLPDEDGVVLKTFTSTNEGLDTEELDVTVDASAEISAGDRISIEDSEPKDEVAVEVDAGISADTQVTVGGGTGGGASTDSSVTLARTTSTSAVVQQIFAVIEEAADS